MAIKESALSLITSIAQGDWVRAVTSAGASRRVTVANLAKAIVESYTGSRLAGSNQSVKSALDSLNSKTTLEAVTFTPASGIATTYLFVRKDGSVVTINGYVTATNAFSTSETLIATLPAGARPADTIRGLAGVASQAYLPGDVAFIGLSTSGRLAITAKSGNAYKVAYFSLSYMAQN